MNSAFSMASRCCSAAILWGGTAVVWAQATLPVDRHGQAVIDNCVTAAQLSFKPGVNGVLLDERDGGDVAQAIVRRYPMIERDGLYPQAVALWRPPKGEWVYATLSQKKHAPHPACFTANVDASTVDATPTLIRKYFSPAP
ncbi:MAG TPA: hypothetical protein VGD46_16500 [Rhizobacter sp.]